MTPFAAGCALCGADLDPDRWRSGPSASQRAGSAFSALWLGPAGPWALGCFGVLVLLYVASVVLNLFSF